MEPRFDMMDSEIGAKFGRRFASTSLVIMNSTLPSTIQYLVALRASQINGCGFCTDAHAKDAAAAGETAVRLSLVPAWRHTTVFTEAERAALELTEEGTRLADRDGVSDETWAQVRKHFDDEQLAALVALVAQINAANRLGVIVRNLGGSYEPGTFAAVGRLLVRAARPELDQQQDADRGQQQPGREQDVQGEADHGQGNDGEKDDDEDGSHGD